MAPEIKDEKEQTCVIKEQGLYGEGLLADPVSEEEQEALDKENSEE